MITLNPDEARVLGVLIEKALTTPNQYPLSLNAVVNGANQTSNRHPVLQLTEDGCFAALESLRGKQLVVRVDQIGSRVHKFKHAAMEVLHCGQPQIAILAELMLRGPQTLGELRGRASRMAAMDSLEAARDVVRSLIERDEPFVRELAPPPGSRAESYAQLLSPDAHDVSSAATVSRLPVSEISTSLTQRVEKLERELEILKQRVAELQNTSAAADLPGH